MDDNNLGHILFISQILKAEEALDSTLYRESQISTDMRKIFNKI